MNTITYFFIWSLGFLIWQNNENFVLRSNFYLIEMIGQHLGPIIMIYSVAGWTIRSTYNYYKPNLESREDFFFFNFLFNFFTNFLNAMIAGNLIGTLHGVYQLTATWADQYKIGSIARLERIWSLPAKEEFLIMKNNELLPELRLSPSEIYEVCQLGKNAEELEKLLKELASVKAALLQKTQANASSWINALYNYYNYVGPVISVLTGVVVLVGAAYGLYYLFGPGTFEVYTVKSLRALEKSTGDVIQASNLMNQRLVRLEVDIPILVQKVNELVLQSNIQKDIQLDDVAAILKIIHGFRNDLGAVRQTVNAHILNHITHH